jgi:hypothetical protein
MRCILGMLESIRYTTSLTFGFRCTGYTNSTSGCCVESSLMALHIFSNGSPKLSLLCAVTSITFLQKSTSLKNSDTYYTPSS